MLNQHFVLVFNLILGLIFALGFAPFQQPICIYLSLLGFFYIIQHQSRFREGFMFGIGLSSLGLSWIYVSIHDYGHLNPILSLLFTGLFVIVIASFYGGLTSIYGYLRSSRNTVLNPLILASTWCLCEWLRAHIFGGFPWLLLGFSSLTTPFAKLLTWFGLYGPSFAITLAIACFVAVLQRHPQAILFSILGVSLFLAPELIQLPQNNQKETIQIGLIQDNVAMQDKWNEEYFWQQFNRYFLAIQDLLAPNRLIVLPEAAISIPSSYVHQELNELNHLAKNKKTALLLGIPQAARHNPNEVYNTLMGLGFAVGQYYKRQLVLFGEEIPNIWHALFKALDIPIVTTLPGQVQQNLIRVFNHPVASLICYELAYPEVLRTQLPKAEWIVSISDDGWFGHSFAVYQHLQMAQTLSFMAQRAQIFVNNNGLSSIISSQGEIVKQLPVWQQGRLTGELLTAHTIVPWMQWGDLPMIILIMMILTAAIFAKYRFNFQVKIERPTES